MSGREELDLIREVSLAAARTADPERVLGLTLELACDHLGAAAGIVWLRGSDDSWRLAHFYAPDTTPPSEELENHPLPPVVGAMLRTETPSTTWQLASTSEPVSARLARAGATVAAAAPVGGSDPAAVLLVALPSGEMLASSGRGLIEALGAVLAPAFARDPIPAGGMSESLEEDLRWAVEQGALEVVYQPVVSLATGRLTAVEALARWNRPGVGPVPPGEFIPAAERAGLTRMLGTDVLLAACEQVARWKDTHATAEDLTVAVNISASQLEDPEFLDTVDEALVRAGLAPRHLMLEITESVASRDVPTATARLHALRERDIRVAVDDFGTGYSSLGRLRDLPVDVLKIDRSFLPSATGDDDDAPVLSALVAVARTLDLHVIAEGVETPQQLAAVLRHDCDEAQGFLFGRPLPAADMDRLLEDPTWDAPEIAAPTPSDQVASRTHLRAVLEDLGSTGSSGTRSLGEALGAVAEVTGFDSMYVTRIDWDEGTQTIVRAHDAGPVEVPEGLVLPWSGSLPQSDRPVDPQQQPEVAQRHAARELGIGTYLGVPIVGVDGDVIGTLCGVAQGRRELADDVRATLGVVATVIGETLRAEVQA